MNTIALCRWRLLRSGKAGGFSLVEILATMALLAIVLPAVIQGISLCLATAGYAEDQALAAGLAQAKLEDLVVARQWERAELSGDFGNDWRGFQWTAELADWEGSTLRELAVTVTWQRRGRQHSATVATLVYTGSDTTVFSAEGAGG